MAGSTLFGPHLRPAKKTLSAMLSSSPQPFPGSRQIACTAADSGAMASPRCTGAGTDLAFRPASMPLRSILLPASTGSGEAKCLCCASIPARGSSPEVGETERPTCFSLQCMVGSGQAVDFSAIQRTRSGPTAPSDTTTQHAPALHHLVGRHASCSSISFRRSKPRRPSPLVSLSRALLCRQRLVDECAGARL